MNLLSKLFKRKVTVCIIVIIALAAGVFFTTQMSVTLLPDISMPFLGVSIVYPGASADAVEDDVTVPLETELRRISNVHSISVTSIENASIAVINYNYGVNLESKKTELKERLANVSLPDSCYEPSIVEVDFNGTAVATVSVYNPSEDIFSSLADAKRLEEKFTAIEGVGSVNLVGAPQNKVVITPIKGLEMTSLLLVQSLGLDQLDIPIGQIIGDDGTILVRNLSSATSVEELRQKPISITLATSTWASLTNAKDALVWYEQSTTVELDRMKTDIDGILQFISEIEDMSNDELDDLNNNLTLLNSVLTLVKNNSATTLEYVMWNNVIKPRVEDPNFQNLTDAQIDDLAKDIGVSASLLRWVRDNSVLEEGQTKSNIEIFWFKMVDFRKAHEVANHVDAETNHLTIDNADYCDLIYDLEIATEYDAANPPSADEDNVYTREELTDAITLAFSINTVGLDSVVTTQKEHNDGVTNDDGEVVSVTNQQYAAMFVASSYDENLPMSASTIGIIRSQHFEQNWQVIYAYKQTHQHVPSQQEIAEMELEENELPPAFLYEKLTSQNLFEVYSSLIIDSELPISLTEELTEFVWTTDFSTLITESDAKSTLNTQIGRVAKVNKEVNYDSVAYQSDFAALVLEVFTVSGANQTQVSKQVKEIIAAEQGNMSSKILLLDDQSEFITDSISNVVSSMIIGGILAVIVILSFLKDVRTSIIIAITMPLSVLCTLACLYFMGISLNMVSLGGLAVGIGMLVDNSIVVIESIALERDKGLTAHAAAVEGTRLVVSPLIASTLTSVCVFFPILFTNGLTKEIFTDLSWSVIFSLSFSLLVAVTVIPTMYCLVFGNKQMLSGRVIGLLKNHNHAKVHSAKKQEQNDCSANCEAKGNADNTCDNEEPQFAEANAIHSESKPKRQRGLAGAIGRLLDKILPPLIKKRWITLLVAAVLFGVSVLLVFSTGMEFLPPSDKGKIEVNISFSPTQDIEECQQQTLNAKKEINDNVENIAGISTQCAKSGILATSLTGTISVQLDDNRGRTADTVEQIRELLADNGYNAVSVTEIDGVVAVMTSGMSGLSVSVRGEDMAQLALISDELTAKLNDLSYVKHIQSSVADLSTEYVLNIDKNKCLDNGIDYSVLVQTLYVGVSGISPSDIKADGETMEIQVIFDETALADYYGGIEKFVVGFDGEGNAIRLADVARIDVSRQATQISREDGKYVMSLDVEIYNIDTGTASSEIMKLTNEVLAQEKFSGYEGAESGVNYYLSDAFGGLVVSLVVSFFLLFGVMACQFESLVKPFIVIFSIPFSFTGGFLAIVLTGTSLNVVSFIGIIMLMGVVVNNAIIMIERIDQLIGDGMQPFDAIIEGTKTRIRPILMTTLTTVVALIPLAFGIGKGADLMQPLGIVVIGGLTLGTVVTLVFIPVMYALIKRVRQTPVNELHKEQKAND